MAIYFSQSINILMLLWPYGLGVGLQSRNLRVQVPNSPKLLYSG